MPELPEMETYRTMLNERIAGRVVRDVEVTREKTVNVPVDEFRRRVEGRAIERVDRAGKMLLFRLDDRWGATRSGGGPPDGAPAAREGIAAGAPAGRGGVATLERPEARVGADADAGAATADTLALHLMLGGSMFYGSPDEAPDRTAQVVFAFDAGKKLYFHGLRLGYLHIYGPEELETKLSKLGPNPLDPALDAEAFAARLRRARGAIKFALTDQAVFAGIGNCYADEMLFAAGILPLRKTADVDDAELRRLFAAMRSTFAEAIRYGGYMEDPLYAGDERTGGYNDRCKVYDRGGEPCDRCGGPITKTESNGRKVFYCERCQR